MKKQAGTWFGEKVEADGYTFDSKKEFQFYEKFIKDSGHPFQVHQPFTLHEAIELVDGAVKIRSSRYTPDFIVYGNDDKPAHVYDLKNSFTSFAIDQAAALRFKWFEKEYGIPVEVVVPRANSFKVKIMGTTKKFEPVVVENVDYTIEELVEKAGFKPSNFD